MSSDTNTSTSEPAGPPEPGTIEDLYEAHNATLTLPSGRTLAYSSSGPPDSPLLIIWFHGMFSTGNASRPNKALRDRRVRFLAADLPGWGKTSPLAPGTTFPETVVADTRALLEHLYPAHNDDDGAPTTVTGRLQIFLAGGSFGTCPAQIVFGAPYDRFPFGRQVVGVLLAAPFSPFREDIGYARSLVWRDWVAVGPPTRVLPFRLVARLFKVAVRGWVRDVGQAEKLLRNMYFDEMAEEERVKFEAWRERNGVEEGEFERKMAEGMVASVGTCWEGFMGIAEALHADWGFRIAELDEEHMEKKVVLVVGKSDLSTYRLSRYLAGQYRNTRVVEVEGGHLSGAWAMDGVWDETLGELAEGEAK